MKKSLLFIVVAITVLLSACQKDDAPVIDFDYTIIGSFSPCEVEFYNQTVGADTYYWEVEGTYLVSADQNPVFSFNSSGTYQVTLTVYGDGGSSELTKTITIPEAATKMVISRIVLSEYPVITSGGESWDTFPSSGADVSLQILDVNDNDNQVINDFGNSIVDVSGQSLEFNYSNPLSLNVINDSYFLNVIDTDTFENEDMGYVSFNPSAYVVGSSAYPDFFVRVQNGITATFLVSWE